MFINNSKVEKGLGPLDAEVQINLLVFACFLSQKTRASLKEFLLLIDHILKMKLIQKIILTPSVYILFCH